MLQVPSVTMKGGSLRRVTSAPLTRPQAMPVRSPSGKEISTRNAADDGESSHHDRGKHHDGADREVDAGGEDDQRLGDAEHADDRHLLQDQREIERVEEAAADQRGEDQRPDQEDDERHRVG